jgi:tungstate transport system substrate-binding protein
MTNARRDVVTAFQDIANEAAANNDVNFVSRGGTPGTTVEEHEIWSLTTGVTTCTVSAANGGGATPSTATGACPQTAPSWYHTTGDTQGPNVVAADSCNFSGGNCYVLTDRGTYQFLESEGALHNLVVVSNDNEASAVGGQNLLVNSFHAYAINPAAFSGNPNVHINLPAATAFLNWLTSPAGQADVTAYQASDPGGPSFIGDAAPKLTQTRTLPARVAAGQPLTVTGTLSNTVPGTPPLAGVAMTLKAVMGGSTTAITVATGNTDATGHYSLTYKPTANASYTVSSAPISQVEDSTLSPVFGDLLQPTSISLGASKVVGTALITSYRAKKGVVTLKGKLSPAVGGTAGQLRVYANHRSLAASEGLKYVAKSPLAVGQKTFTMTLKLHRGFTWDVSVHYMNTGRIATGVSPVQSVRVT